MARCTKQTENKQNNLRNDIKREKQTNFTQWHQQSDLKSTKVSQNREKVPKVSMDRVIWAQSKTKRNLSAEKNNHSKIAIKRWKTTKRLWRNNQRIDWTNKTPKLLNAKLHATVHHFVRWKLATEGLRADTNKMIGRQSMISLMKLMKSKTFHSNH